MTGSEVSGTDGHRVGWERLADGVGLKARGLSMRVVWEAPGVLRAGARRRIRAATDWEPLPIDAGAGWILPRARHDAHWDETAGVLIVERAVGDFPGRATHRVLRARLVEPGSGWLDESAACVTAEQHDRQLRIPLGRS